MPMHNEHSPNESIHAAPHANVHSTRITFSDRVSIIALVLAGIAIGVLIVMPSLIESKVQAGIAKAEAVSHAADVNSRIALDEVERTREALAVKGIVIPKH